LQINKEGYTSFKKSCDIRKIRTIIDGYQTCIILPKNQISARCMYIEAIQTIGINEIIADLKAISYIYSGHSAYVKPFNRKGGTL
jgi:hypothetical protein